MSICVITYNQELFIRHCLESILNQNMDCDYEVIIGDDNSSDNTYKICEQYASKYPKIIKLKKRSKNLGMIGNWVKTISESKGKYIALCEGDDYWEDNYRLMKQIEFLENNSTYSICWTKYKELKDDIFKVPYGIKTIEHALPFTISFDNFSTPYCTHTLTTVFKSSAINLFDLSKFKFFKDNTLFALCLEAGKGKVLDIDGGVYRVHPNGVYSLANGYKKALSNYTNYEEILSVIKPSRVKNIITKRNNWKQEFLRELYNLPKSKFKKRCLRLKHIMYFKYLRYINGVR